MTSLIVETDRKKFTQLVNRVSDPKVKVRKPNSKKRLRKIKLHKQVTRIQKQSTEIMNIKLQI